MPTISVVIPTRDRPLFVREALKSLADQEFTDFEAIVADNPETTPCEDVVEEFGDERFRYLRAETPLAMHDNWEAGCAAASGEYVGLMNDKIVWLPSTMSRALSLVEEASVAVVSWWCSSFLPRDEASDPASGHYHPYDHPPSGPTTLSSEVELASAMAFDAPRGVGPGYFRGNICYGLYRQDVMEGIRDRLGRVFPPICPDYTSRVGALLTVPTFVDAGAPLQLACTTVTSTVRQAEEDPLHTKRFIDGIDPALMDRLPIPGLWASLHNVVAHDYAIGEGLGGPKLNRANLAVGRARTSEEIRAWPDEATRQRAVSLLHDAEQRAGGSQAAVRLGPARQGLSGRGAALGADGRDLIYRLLLRMPRLRRTLRGIAGKPPMPDTLRRGDPSRGGGARLRAPTRAVTALSSCLETSE